MDGVVLTVPPSVDHRPGSVVTLLLDGVWPEGEGWAFLYEHVDLIEGLAEGSRVSRGQEIARSPLSPREANNHLQLTYLFESKTFSREHTCWVDHLKIADRTSLLLRFGDIRAGDSFHEAWETAQEEDAFVYRGLLDREDFPDGPALCYPQGADVRQPQSAAGA